LCKGNFAKEKLILALGRNEKKNPTKKKEQNKQTGFHAHIGKTKGKESQQNKIMKKQCAWRSCKL
jgi:hypothetical protein